MKHMRTWVTTIPCPRCKHDNNTILGFYKDEKGYHLGQRVHCNACEHVWDDLGDPKKGPITWV